MKYMPSVYIHRDSRSIADLNTMEDGVVLISRINVPARQRGQGIATDILNEIIKDANDRGVTLILEPVPSGGLSYNQLVAWYERHGFEWFVKKIENGKFQGEFKLMRKLPSVFTGEEKNPSIERSGFANHIRGLSSIGLEGTEENKSVS